MTNSSPIDQHLLAEYMTRSDDHFSRCFHNPSKRSASPNYYITGHPLKIMTGVDYATISGKDTWTAMTAIRLFWGPHSKGPVPMAQTLKGAD